MCKSGKTMAYTFCLLEMKRHNVSWIGSGSGKNGIGSATQVLMLKEMFKTVTSFKTKKITEIT